MLMLIVAIVLDIGIVIVVDIFIDVYNLQWYIDTDIGFEVVAALILTDGIVIGIGIDTDIDTGNDICIDVGIGIWHWYWYPY